jgi:hypothetical protein
VVVPTPITACGTPDCTSPGALKYSHSLRTVLPKKSVAVTRHRYSSPSKRSRVGETEFSTSRFALLSAGSSKDTCPLCTSFTFTASSCQRYSRTVPVCCSNFSSGVGSLTAIDPVGSVRLRSLNSSRPPDPS